MIKEKISLDIDNYSILKIIMQAKSNIYTHKNNKRY